MTTPIPTPPSDGPITAPSIKPPTIKNHIDTALGKLASRFATTEDKNRPGDAFDPGMVARLRRHPAGGGASIDVWSALHTTLKLDVLDILVPQDRAETARRAGRAWGLVLHGMALMAPNPHQKGRLPGAALADARFSQARLIQLLRAEDQAFADHFATACRFLRAKGECVDWIRFGRLALERLNAPGIPHSQQDHMAEIIACDYVRAVYHTDHPASAEAKA